MPEASASSTVTVVHDHPVPARRGSSAAGLNVASRLRRRVSNLFVKRQGADLYVPPEARANIGDDDQFGFGAVSADEKCSGPTGSAQTRRGRITFSFASLTRLVTVLRGRKTSLGSWMHPLTSTRYR